MQFDVVGCVGCDPGQRRFVVRRSVHDQVNLATMPLVVADDPFEVGHEAVRVELVLLESEVELGRLPVDGNGAVYLTTAATGLALHLSADTTLEPGS